MHTLVDLKPIPESAPPPVRRSLWLSEALLWVGGTLALLSGALILGLQLPEVFR